MAGNRVVKTFGWFIGGALVGAAAGLLIAPKRGEETRQDIADWLRKKREQTKELAARLKEQIPAKKDQVVAAVKAGKDAYQQVGESRKEPVAA
jgi:gas vesicle protein